jgi:hypothetical protein
MCGNVQNLGLQDDAEVRSGQPSGRTVVSPGRGRSNYHRLFVNNSKLEARDFPVCQGFGVPLQVEGVDVANDVANGGSRCDSHRMTVVSVATTDPHQVVTR